MRFCDFLHQHQHIGVHREIENYIEEDAIRARATKVENVKKMITDVGDFRMLLWLN